MCCLLLPLAYVIAMAIWPVIIAFNSKAIHGVTITVSSLLLPILWFGSQMTIPSIVALAGLTEGFSRLLSGVATVLYFACSVVILNWAYRARTEPKGVERRGFPVVFNPASKNEDEQN